MQLNDIKKLVNLARIDMTEDEMSEIGKDFDSILAYVGQVENLSTKDSVFDPKEEDYFLRNIMREDEVTNKRGEYTDKILGQAPNTQDGFLKVKQIL